MGELHQGDIAILNLTDSRNIPIIDQACGVQAVVRKTARRVFLQRTKEREMEKKAKLTAMVHGAG
jgi:hypothetical protein